MAQVLQDVRKRALADVSNAKSRPCKAGRPAEDSKPLTADTAAAQAAMAPGAVQSSNRVPSDTHVHAAKAVSQATQSDAEEASETVPTCPGSPASDASCNTECDSPAEPDRCTSPSPPPCQAEQQSAYLLLKACEREDAAEERADAAEAALAEANRKLAATEAALAAAQTRLQLLEVGATAALPACRYHDHGCIYRHAVPQVQVSMTPHQTRFGWHAAVETLICSSRHVLKCIIFVATGAAAQ